MKNILAVSEIADAQVTPLDLMLNVANSARYAAISA